MLKILTGIFMLSLLFFAGCAVSHPQTAEEFRQAVPKSSFAKMEQFVVNRRLKDVAKTFRKMAPKCFNKRIKTVSTGYMHHQVIVTAYKPTVKVSKSHVELHLQQKHEQGVKAVSKMPNGGYYLLVTDAVAQGPRKTRVTIYYPSMGHKVTVKAIKGWAKGEILGCPDLSKI